MSAPFEATARQRHGSDYETRVNQWIQSHIYLVSCTVNGAFPHRLPKPSHDVSDCGARADLLSCAVSILRSAWPSHNFNCEYETSRLDGAHKERPVTAPRCIQQPVINDTDSMLDMTPGSLHQSLGLAYLYDTLLLCWIRLHQPAATVDITVDSQFSFIVRRSLLKSTSPYTGQFPPILSVSNPIELAEIPTAMRPLIIPFTTRTV